jgi:hypothetical protein
MWTFIYSCKLGMLDAVHEYGQEHAVMRPNRKHLGHSLHNMKTLRLCLIMFRGTFGSFSRRTVLRNNNTTDLNQTKDNAKGFVEHLKSQFSVLKQNFTILCEWNMEWTSNVRNKRWRSHGIKTGGSVKVSGASRHVCQSHRGKDMSMFDRYRVQERELTCHRFSSRCLLS